MVCEDCKPIFEKFDGLVKRVKDLENRLLAFENAHTPSSKRRFPPRIINENKQAPGQKPGHPGLTRASPDPTMTLEMVEEQCPHCRAQLGVPFRTTTRVIEEIPEPQPLEVTEYKINHYLCPKCKKEIVAHAPIPETGRFGVNATAHIALLKFEDRLPLRKVCASLGRQSKFPLSSGSVFEITDRVSEAVAPAYERMKTTLRCSLSVNIDETEIRVGGLNYHLWVFTNKLVTLYVIRRSRGKQVIEEVLGKDYRGVIGCDGWTSYASYSDNLQRCWAHLLREAKYLAEEHASAKSLYVGLKGVYKKAVSENPPSKEDLILELNQWTDYAESYRELRKFVTKIRNGIEYWFTFLDHEGVEPTNNRAERALRELIVQRKIMGTLRNEKGATIMERITSCIATWKQQGLNTFAELKAQLC